MKGYIVCLLFNDIYQLQKISSNWREDYNYNHPHKSLGNKTTKEYLPRFDEFRGALCGEAYSFLL
ncbi:integrase core domain-containing protein [Lacinutrix sp. Hel_I_90]|uniref:integrase core domain-containing protein n=1 Tax=Lacinutrix sp. Hel_I_90 TaxID=1249999 RepID=UPI0009E43875